MNKHYTLISASKLPMLDGDERMTTIYTYVVDEEKYNFLCNVSSYQRNDGTFGPHNPAPIEVVEAGRVEDVIEYDLGLADDTCVAPGALYHTYDVTALLYHRVVIVADIVGYNV